MPLVDLACAVPGCGQPLRRFNLDPLGGQITAARDAAATGNHIHMEMTGTVTCSNNHKWTASGSFILTRDT